jgi:hypothetical protein
MNNKHSRPNWWILNLLIGVFMLVLYLEVKAPFSKAGHIWAEIGLVLLVYGLVAGWLKANEAALIREDWEISKPSPIDIPVRRMVWPAWLSAFWLYLGDLFHRLPWVR